MKLSGYRGDIDGLRAIAVGLVVAFHVMPRRLHGGFIGVDVFFVLSGYLITGLLVREIEETGALSLAGFYARRARRLLPVSTLVLLVTILACAMFLSPMQQYRLGSSGSQTALYVSNFWFLRQAMDYFSAGVRNNPFLHTWSLAVEEQFYLIWPAIVLFALRGKEPRKRLLWFLIAIVVTSLVACIWLTRISQPWAFYTPVARAWEFGAGAITLLLARDAVPDGQAGRWRVFTGWFGLAAILGAAALLHGETGFPGWFAIVPVIGTVGILCFPSRGGGVTGWLENSGLQLVGRLSYAWYLWHWPVLTIVRAMPRTMTASASFYEAFVCVVGSLALAGASHVLVENPVRFSRYLASRKTLSLALAGLLTLLSLTVATVWQKSAVRAASTLENGGIMATLGVTDEDRNACPAVETLSSDVADCVLGNSAGTKSIVLFGDSHASQWRPAFDSIARDRGWRLDLIYKPACPTAQVTIFNASIGRTYTECDQWRVAALKKIIAMRPVAVVIANRQLQNFASNLNGPNATWRDGSRKTLESLDAAGIRTILLRDTPSPGFDVPDCVAGDTSWWTRKRASLADRRDACTINRVSALNEGFFRAEQAAAEGLRNVSVLDLSDLFCDGAGCPSVKNGFIVYRDESHIAPGFARSIAGAVGTRLAPMIGP